jgi:hypothetical protein
MHMQERMLTWHSACLDAYVQGTDGTHVNGAKQHGNGNGNGNGHERTYTTWQRRAIDERRVLLNG